MKLLGTLERFEKTIKDLKGELEYETGVKMKYAKTINVLGKERDVL